MGRLRQQNSSFLLLEASHIKRKIDGNSYLINRNLWRKQYEKDYCNGSLSCASTFIGWLWK